MAVVARRQPTRAWWPNDRRLVLFDGQPSRLAIVACWPGAQARAWARAPTMATPWRRWRAAVRQTSTTNEERECPPSDNQVITQIGTKWMSQYACVRYGRGSYVVSQGDDIQAVDASYNFQLIPELQPPCTFTMDMMSSTYSSSINYLGVLACVMCGLPYRLHFHGHYMISGVCQYIYRP